ncbi:hypothetical protein [Thiohalorhabdus methylotrophus]|uniref:Uncharacterized protein n=1 Tax=Thiohalorhabdus methylotrophus TaxID=3242694 RepID=A0ABV4TVP6_9GAMM
MRLRTRSYGEEEYRPQRLLLVEGEPAELFDDYLLKPPTMDSLRQALERMQRS